MKAIKGKFKDDLQPVQVRYFNGSGEPFFKMSNCYVDPSIPMRWNVQHTLDAFPPKPLKELKVNHSDQLQNLLPFIKTMDGKSVSLNNLQSQIITPSYFGILTWFALLNG